jgi:nucleolar protein 58
MLVLYETALGYCLFKVSNSAKLESADLWKEFESPEKANKLYVREKSSESVFSDFLARDLSQISLKLKALHRFTSTATAVEDITAIQAGKLGKGLKQFLTDEVVNKGKGKESLVVVEQSLGGSCPLLPHDTAGLSISSSSCEQAVQSPKN